MTYTKQIFQDCNPSVAVTSQTSQVLVLLHTQHASQNITPSVSDVEKKEIRNPSCSKLSLACTLGH